MSKSSKITASELVLSAIFFLQQKNGITAKDITKFICEKRGCKQSFVRSEVKRALERATENGIFSKKRGLYRIESGFGKNRISIRVKGMNKNKKGKKRNTNLGKNQEQDAVSHFHDKVFDAPLFERDFATSAQFSKKSHNDEEPNMNINAIYMADKGSRISIERIKMTGRNEEDDDDDDFLDEDEEVEDDDVDYFSDDQFPKASDALRDDFQEHIVEEEEEPVLEEEKKKPTPAKRKAKSRSKSRTKNKAKKRKLSKPRKKTPKRKRPMRKNKKREKTPDYEVYREPSQNHVNGHGIFESQEKNQNNEDEQPDQLDEYMINCDDFIPEEHENEENMDAEYTDDDNVYNDLKEQFLDDQENYDEDYADDYQSQGEETDQGKNRLESAKTVKAKNDAVCQKEKITAIVNKNPIIGQKPNVNLKRNAECDINFSEPLSETSVPEYELPEEEEEQEEEEDEEEEEEEDEELPIEEDEEEEKPQCGKKFREDRSSSLFRTLKKKTSSKQTKSKRTF